MTPNPLYPKPQVGETVLFRIGSNIYRPLLVTATWEVTPFNVPQWAVAGELFLRWEEDRRAPYLQQNSFYLPSKDSRSIEIKEALPGDLIGNWAPRAVIPAAATPLEVIQPRTGARYATIPPDLPTGSLVVLTSQKEKRA